MFALASVGGLDFAVPKLKLSSRILKGLKVTHSLKAFHNLFHRPRRLHAQKRLHILCALDDLFQDISHLSFVAFLNSFRLLMSSGQFQIDTYLENSADKGSELGGTRRWT